MTPSQFSSALRHVASKLDNSKNPDKELVVKDLRQLLAALEQPVKQESTEKI